MRLARLDLVRFGHFSDFTLNMGPADGPSFHVILGPNEAGKSTVVEAWLNLLYGIPINTSYAFRHPRNTLEIRAVVDDGDGPVTLTRTPQRTNNLLDQTGAPVPPAVLTAMLRGVSEQAYRALYCLDDETIEKGGEDILASKGDLGQLLFAAASGMEAFNAEFEAERAADRAYHRHGPGQRSTELFTKKKQIEELKLAGEAIDLTVSEYRRLRREAEEAVAADDDARSRHSELTLKDVRLRDRLAALPVMAELDEMVTRLSALGDLPEVAEDAEAEMAALAERRAAHLSTLQTRRSDAAGKAAERGEITVDDAAAALPGQLAALAGLRSRAVADAEDLPRRRDEADERRSRATRLLGDLGLPEADPTELRLARPALEKLDRAVKARDLVAQKVAQLDAERDRAERALASARQAAAAVAVDDDAETGVSGSLRDLLTRCDLPRLADELVAAERAHGAAASAAGAARAALAIGTTAFASCPDVALTPDAAQTLADRIRDLEIRAEQLNARIAEDRTAIAHDEARAATLASQGADVSDAAAEAARARRDDLWLAHRTALTGPTADAFERALAEEDALTVQRLAEGARLADLRQLELDLAEARAAVAQRSEDLGRVERDLSAAGAELAGHLRTIGLPASLGATGLVEWLAEHARTAVTERAEQETARDLDALRHRAAPLWQAMIDLLGAGTPGDPAALVRAGQDRLHDVETRAKNRESVRRAVAAAEAGLAEREATVQAAATALTTAESDLAEATGALGLALPNILVMADALPVLRELAAECEALAGLTDRIGKLEHNATVFAGEVAGIAAPWPDLAGQPPLAQADALDRITDQARKDLDRRERLAGEIDEAARQIGAAERALAETEAAARRLAAAFPDPPEDFEAIRTAIGRAAEATRLRAAIARAEARLCALLDVLSAEQARADLDGASEADLRAQLETLAPDLAAAGEARDQAIRARTRAEDALRAVGDDDEAARLAQEHRTALEDLAAGTETALVRRLALMLSNRALDRYRDRHRSAMLTDAAAAFADLTDGAYPSLAAQPTERGDVLIARRASDGHSLRADEASMSKGTRFQLYLALRLAGYRQMAADGTILPFLCDDVFETFDEDRTAAACRLMHRIGTIGQALYFTHHAHVAEIARAECGVDGVAVHRL